MGVHRLSAPAGVHPCGCRGNRYSAAIAASLMGSSLRMQGQLRRHLRRSERVGFIPADAGATLAEPGIAAQPPVHPCGCRGNTTCDAGTSTVWGSSLRMQGQPRPRARLKSACGFIPADAGATSCGPAGLRCAGVHPCGCRGNRRAKSVWPKRKGSSLRMQGQLRGPAHPAQRCGFIPADAGATACGPAEHSQRRVHPCGCRGNPCPPPPPQPP
ncbi:hypothetical protein SAMN05880556_13216 [Azospirillum sp. RU38E]|nr:hypothetical protein SAMN05880556_13216 [Azospirillum sp. RU38E]SNT31392.1 hypothetical protein SAMN05880591_13216 [Azospirillum sp. RU37A]